MVSADLIVIEVGSTITKVKAIGHIGGGSAQLIADSFSLTTVKEGDVLIGIDKALLQLAEKLGGKALPKEMLASSSAAGGLKMAVLGLAPEMTLRAAKEASLGAGAVIKFLHAGKMKERHLKALFQEMPNILLLAGGTDGGDEETVLYNAAMLAKQEKILFPIVYAGNQECIPEIKEILKHIEHELFIVPNVYPKVDILNVEPTRRIIKEVFSEHIVKAPGMQHLRDKISGQILPVPAAVLKSAELLSTLGEEVLVIDIGGATSDVHSVTDGNNEYKKMALEPEPRSKRTVEGDLGVYVNALHVLKETNGDSIEGSIDLLKAIPQSDEEMQLSYQLGKKALQIAVARHCGRLIESYTATGKINHLKGKDLTAITKIIGTGGVLTRLRGGSLLLQEIRKVFDGIHLLPGLEAKIAIDHDYIFSTAGVISQKYPEDALHLIQTSLAKGSS